MEPMPAVRVDHVTKKRGDNLALDGLSFEVEQGRIFGLIGPNGAGKTTCMQLLLGMLVPDSGATEVFGEPSLEMSIGCRQRIGYLPETPPLYPEMTCRSYLTYVAKIKEVPRAARRGAVDQAIERCGLGDVYRRVISTLSKGFRQRVGIAQAILGDPPVLILDEPTVGLDPLQIREIRSLIAGFAAPGKGETQQTVVLSTHILAEVEAICRRVILISGGRKQIDAPITELTSGGRSLEEIFTQETLRDASVDQDLEGEA